MEILTVSEIHSNSPSFFLGPNSPSREKSPQLKVNTKNSYPSKISPGLQYVPKKPSSLAEPKSDSVISNTPIVPSSVTATHSLPTTTTKIGKNKKIPIKTKPAVIPKKKVSLTLTSTPSKSDSVHTNNNNSSPKNNTRVPLSTIYDSNSNLPKRTEYRPVSKKNNNNSNTLKPEEHFLEKLLDLPSVNSPKSITTAESFLISPQNLNPLPFQAPELIFTSPSTPLPLQADESSLKPVKLPKKTKVYDRSELLAIGKLPICSVPHSGKSPSEIIKEYNLQYAQQEKEFSKLQEEEKLIYKQPNLSLHSSYTNVPNISHSVSMLHTSCDSINNLNNNNNIHNNQSHSNISNSVNMLHSSCDSINNLINNNNIHNNKNHSTKLSPSSSKNNKIWIPRKSTDSLNTLSSSSPETPNISSYSSLQVDQPQQGIISQNQHSTNQNSPKFYNNNNNNYYYHNNDLLLQSPHQHQRVQQVIYSTDYGEPDQNEFSDEEYEGYEESNLLQFSLLQEISPKRLESRQKQIDIGKNTPGYKNYIHSVKKEKRKYYDPHTPDKYQICSKRSWDGQIRVWRRLLHLYDNKKNY